MLCKIRSHENSFTKMRKYTGNKVGGGRKKKVELSIVVKYDFFVYCAKLQYLIVSSRFKSCIE